MGLNARKTGPQLSIPVGILIDSRMKAKQTE